MTNKKEYAILKIPIDRKELRKSKYYLKGFEKYIFNENEEYLFLLWLCSYCSQKNSCKKNIYDKLICVNNALEGKLKRKTTNQLITDVFDEMEKKNKLNPIFKQ